MKHILFALLLIFATASVQAQFEIGIKTGISSTELSPRSIIFKNGNSQLSIADANYGFHLGLYTRVSVANLFIEPALLLNSSTVDYNLREELFDTGVFNSIRTERYNNLDIPVLVGMKMGPFRIQGGPVAHFFINSASDLVSVEGYRQAFDSSSFGVQGGIGLDIFRFRFDVNYEANLSKFGDHIEVDGTAYDFDQRPARLIASLGFKF